MTNRCLLAAVYCPGGKEDLLAEKLAEIHDYADEHGIIIIHSFKNEKEILVQDCIYDVILTCADKISSPIPDVKVIDVSQVG